MVKRALLVLALHACTLFDDPPPTNTCKSDADCFRAQGEHCDVGAHMCVMGPSADAGVDAL